MIEDMKKYYISRTDATLFFLLLSHWQMFKRWERTWDVMVRLEGEWEMGVSWDKEAQWECQLSGRESGRVPSGALTMELSRLYQAKTKILLLPTLWIGNLLLLACVIPSSNASLPSDHTHAHCFACKSIVCPVTETVWTHVLSTFVITKYFLLLFGFMYSRSVIFDRENNETLLDWRKQMFDREPFFQTDRSVC